MSFKTLTAYLWPCSMIYLLLPTLIFFIAWLNTPMAILCVSLSLVPLILYFWPLIFQQQSQPKDPVQHSHQSLGLTWSHLFVIFIVALSVTSMSGIGGYGPQDSDWLKHNAFLKDLITYDWPLVYDFQGVPLPAVYYIAYYLSATFFGKLSNFTVANHILFIWSLIGLILTLLWFVILIKRQIYLCLFIFFIFSGLDSLGTLLHVLILEFPKHWDHLEWWAENWQYSSNITLYFFVPHQALGGWITSGLILYTLLYEDKRDNLLFYVSLTPLWSPLVTLGLLPFLVVDFWVQSGSYFKRVKPYLSWPNVCGVNLMIFYLIFFSAKFYPIPLPLKQSIYGLIFQIPETKNPTWLLIANASYIFLASGVWLICPLYFDESEKSVPPAEGFILGHRYIFNSITPLQIWG